MQLSDFWTTERVGQLTLLWANGSTAAQIAREMGAVSRNAIIGKASRLKLAPRGRGRSGAGRPKIRYTADVVKRVQGLAADGYSSKEIAKMIGTTGASVSTFCYRNGIKLRHRGGRPSYDGDKWYLPGYRRPRRNIYHRAVSLVEQQPIGEFRHLSLLELTKQTCRWPQGTGPYTFCGCATMDKLPYCAAHTAQAYDYHPTNVVDLVAKRREIRQRLAAA